MFYQDVGLVKGWTTTLTYTLDWGKHSSTNIKFLNMKDKAYTCQIETLSPIWEAFLDPHSVFLLHTQAIKHTKNELASISK